MNSFYNIIKIASDTGSCDSIAIGLIAYSNDRYHLSFSDKKIKIVKSLLGEEGNLTHFLEIQLSKWIERLNATFSSNENLLFKEKLIGADYFNYLSRYSNNMIQFSKPYFLSKPINDDDFKNLFKLLIDRDSQQQNLLLPSYIEFETKIRIRLLDKVKDRVHINAPITEKIIPSLYYSFEVDCIGMNGVITAAKSVDFNKSDITIDRNLSHYFQVSALLAKKYNKEREANNFFLIADEPSDMKSKEHHIWEQLQKQPQFLLIPSDESDRVANKIEETKAQKFLELQD
jgi:hypothetical protein